MIKRFNQVRGKYIEKIIGQERYAYAISDKTDFHDLIEWAKRGGYPGSTIIFYDFENGKTYEPFKKKRDTVYGSPIFAKDFYYFLQLSFLENTISLYKYLPCKVLEKVVDLKADDNNLSTEDYDFYYKILERDFSVKILSEELGQFYQAIDGTWWIT